MKTLEKSEFSKITTWYQQSIWNLDLIYLIFPTRFLLPVATTVFTFNIVHTYLCFHSVGKDTEYIYHIKFSSMNNYAHFIFKKAPEFYPFLEKYSFYFDAKKDLSSYGALAFVTLLKLSSLLLDLE